MKKKVVEGLGSLLLLSALLSAPFLFTGTLLYMVLAALVLIAVKHLRLRP